MAAAAEEEEVAAAVMVEEAKVCGASVCANVCARVAEAGRVVCARSHTRA